VFNGELLQCPSPVMQETWMLSYCHHHDCCHTVLGLCGCWTLQSAGRQSVTVDCRKSQNVTSHQPTGLLCTVDVPPKSAVVSVRSLIIPEPSTWVSFTVVVCSYAQSGQLSLLPSVGWEISNSLLATGVW